MRKSRLSWVQQGRLMEHFVAGTWGIWLQFGSMSDSGCLCRLSSRPTFWTQTGWN
jgi:hypothetical protein